MHNLLLGTHLTGYDLERIAALAGPLGSPEVMRLTHPALTSTAVLVSARALSAS